MLLVYFIVAALVAVWLLLTLSAALSWRWTQAAPQRRSKRRLAMALLPVLLGLFLLNFHLRFETNGAATNLSWPFVVPVVLGAVALFVWTRARRNA